MQIQRKFVASALGLFVLLTAPIEGVLNSSTHDDMHWPIKPSSVIASASIDGCDDMHWPTCG